MKLTGRRQSGRVQDATMAKGKRTLWRTPERTTNTKGARLFKYSDAASISSIDNLRYSQRAANMDARKRDFMDMADRTRDSSGKIKDTVALKAFKSWYKRNKK